MRASQRREAGHPPAGHSRTLQLAALPPDSPLYRLAGELALPLLPSGVGLQGEDQHAPAQRAGGLSGGCRWGAWRAQHGVQPPLQRGAQRTAPSGLRHV